MTINPCCIPLKMGVRIVTHVSMALAICVGWTALKLMSISLEVSTEIAADTTSTNVIKRLQGPHYPEQTTNVFDGVPPTFYNSHNFRNHQTLPPPLHPPYDPYHFRVPYDYILFYNWYQHQLRQHHNSGNQPQRRHQDTLSSVYDQDELHSVGLMHPKTPETGKDDEMRFGPIPPLLPPPPPDKPLTLPPIHPDGKFDDDEDENYKIFRSILHHRKNFRGRVSPQEDHIAVTETLRNLKESEDGAELSSTTSFLPTPSPRVQVRDEGESGKERGHVPADWSPFFREHEKGPGNTDPSQHYFSPEVVAAAQLSARQHQQEKDAHEMNRRMMSTSTREYSQRDGTHGSGSQSTGRSTNNLTSKRQLPDFKEQYAKVLLVCGLLALCTVIFQFFTSFLLLCFVDKGSNAAAQIWTAVNCSVIFCLATCLVLFLCEGLSIAKYSFDETLYLSLVTVDSLLSIYFLWVVMAFI